MNRLKGRNAIVTGTSPNIGGALAKGLAAAGARVVCTDITEESAQGCADAIVEDGGEAVAVVGDVSDPAHADAAVAAAVDAWGQVDILVNNAVWFCQRGLLDMSYDDYSRQLDVILGGAFLFSRAVANSMIDTGTRGSIINVLSTAAWQGQPGNVGYSTGKSGLINFTRSVAMELAVYGIRVNGFTPTATRALDDTTIANQLARKAASSHFDMDFPGLMPWDRLPTAADYVPTVVFLASDDAAMITGTNITVDGGATAKYWPWVPSKG